MAEKWITAVVSVALGIIGLATIAVLVSRQAQTGGVFGAGAGALSNALCAALSPIGVQCGNLTPVVNSTITFPSDGGTGVGSGRLGQPNIGSNQIPF